MGGMGKGHLYLTLREQPTAIGDLFEAHLIMDE